MNELKKAKSLHSGFTLIEALLGIVIGAIVITVTWNFFQLGQETFKRSQTRVDAQSQLRMVMHHIKTELSVAKNVQIISTVPDTFDESAGYFYILNNTLVLKEDTADPQAPPGCLSLPGLQITFSKVTQGGKIVRISMVSADGTELESDIFVQNHLTPEIGGVNTGNIILFETVD